MSKGQSQLAGSVAMTRPTPAAVARDVGVTRQAVIQWIHGIAKPRPEHREQLERLLGIPAASWDEPA